MRFRSGYGKQGRRFVPRLERLDERALPSISVVETDGTLVISGDQHANTIVIEDNGTADAGNVQVTIDGQIFTSQGAITSIQVLGRSGSDSVEYDLTADLSTLRTVDVNLGNGNDTFVANLNGNLLSGSGLILVAKGGNGKDQLSFEAANTDVAAGANLTACLLGGNGMDDLSIDYSGLLQGAATLSADGGNGKDSVSGNVALVTRTDPSSGTTSLSTGSLNLDLEGGNGVDAVTGSLTGETDLGSLLAVVNGGRGKDTFTLTDNLSAVDASGPKH